MNEAIFKSDAKQIVDMFFDTKIFKEDISRDDMNTIEELIEYLLRSRYDMYVKGKELTDKLTK